jgi:cytoskeletal protein CcmA (bactofilin family)
MLTKIPSFTVVAEGSRTQGSMLFSSQAIILGLIEGNVFQHSNETLTIGKTGWIRGEVSSQGPVVIRGRIEGNVFSKSKILVLETATVSGALVCPSIEIRPGARIESDILMHWSSEQNFHKPLAA